MKVKDVICAAGRSGYMHRDLAAIKSGTATPDGSLYRGKPMSPGFTHIIEPATIIALAERYRCTFTVMAITAFTATTGSSLRRRSGGLNASSILIPIFGSSRSKTARAAPSSILARKAV